MGSDIKQTRVILWCVPRSASTAFEFAMEQADTSCVLHEPYGHAKYFGVDRMKRTPPVPEAALLDGYSYREVLEMLKKPYRNHNVVFCKDMAFGVYNKLEYLPSDYQHTFLIRDPRKSIPSFNKILLGMQLYQEPDNMDFELCGFEACEVLLKHVTSSLGQPPIVIDSDDLLNDPEGILREYCRLTGIPFTPRMLNYEAEMLNWPDKSKTLLSGFYKRAIESRSFGPCKLSGDWESEPDRIRENIKLALPYYERLNSQRITFSSS